MIRREEIIDVCIKIVVSSLTIGCGSAVLGASAYEAMIIGGLPIYLALLGVLFIGLHDLYMWLECKYWAWKTDNWSREYWESLWKDKS